MEKMMEDALLQIEQALVRLKACKEPCTKIAELQKEIGLTTIIPDPGTQEGRVKVMEDLDKLAANMILQAKELEENISSASGWVFNLLRIATSVLERSISLRYDRPGGSQEEQPQENPVGGFIGRDHDHR